METALLLAGTAADRSLIARHRCVKALRELRNSGATERTLRGSLAAPAEAFAGARLVPTSALQTTVDEKADAMTA